jgi:hypothetical protein
VAYGARVRISALGAPLSLKLVLPLLLAVGLLAPVASPVDAAVPRAEVHRKDLACRADAPFYHDGALPGRMLLAAGNGEPGRYLTMHAAEEPHGPNSYPSEMVSTAKPGLNRARLEAMERRGVHAAYFSGWHPQLRTLTRRLVARVATCPGEAQVLMGYSQGALVVRALLHNLARTAKGRDLLDHIAGVVLIGDPAANRHEKIKRYGGAKGGGVIATRIPLPRILVTRRLVTSVCAVKDPVCSSTPKTRKGKPTKQTARKPVRSHLAYDLGLGKGDIDTVAERAITDMFEQLVERYAAMPQWADVCWGDAGVPSVACNARREGDTFSVASSARGYRLVGSATTLPAGVSVSSDLTLSGVVPDRDHDDLVVGFTSPTVAPAVVRRVHVALGGWPRATARPGVQRISHALGGGPANGASSQPDLSADGHRVAFVSSASDLVAGDTNGAGLDVFVWDRATDTTQRLAVGDASTAWPDVSSDGRYVEFTTKARLAGDTDDLADVFVWDTQTGTVQLASPGTAVPVVAGSIAPDGATVFFREDPTGRPAIGNAVRSWDRVGETVTAVPPPAGWSWTIDSNNPIDPRPWAASPDGRYVLMQSTAADRAGLWDRQTGAQHGVGCGVAAGSFVTGAAAAVAADGSTFSFTNYFPNNRVIQNFRFVCAPLTGDHLDAGTTVPFNAAWQLVASGDLPAVQDRTTGVRSTPTTEPPQSGPTVWQFTTFTADGSTIVFGSTAQNILDMPFADLGRSEVYLWDRTVSP